MRFGRRPCHTHSTAHILHQIIIAPVMVMARSQVDDYVCNIIVSGAQAAHDLPLEAA
jgi:hypothetical protein